MQEDSLQYQIYPRIDKLDCRTDEIGGGAGPTAQTQRRLLQSDSSSNAAKLGLVCAFWLWSIAMLEASILV